MKLSMVLPDNLASFTPLAQWFYHWVREMNLQAPYPSLERAKEALQNLPNFRRYSRNVPDLESGESWVRFLLRTGELIRLQAAPGQPSLTVAVYVSSHNWGAYEKICSPEFSAARRALGIDKHLMIVMSEKETDGSALMHVIESLVRESSECAFMDLTSDVLCAEPAL